MPKLPVRVVTDSTADIPREIAEELGITVVPLNVHFGNDVYRDGLDLSPQQFVAKLRASPVLPTTSQPSVGIFEEVYRRLAPAPILSVHIAANLSGTINSARLAAVSVAGSTEVVVVDSLSTTMGLGWLAVLAARAARDGAASARWPPFWARCSVLSP